MENNQVNNEAIQTVKYLNDRRSAYPTLTEQLDMLYKDKLNNTNIWFETIKSIKEKYPKHEDIS